jgi:hypothetical protein
LGSHRVTIKSFGISHSIPEEPARGERKLQSPARIGHLADKARRILRNR